VQPRTEVLPRPWELVLRLRLQEPLLPPPLFPRLALLEGLRLPLVPSSRPSGWLVLKLTQPTLGQAMPLEPLQATLPAFQPAYPQPPLREMVQ
jgi:hypothetical protein